jgi:hypothetical protein
MITSSNHRIRHEAYNTLKRCTQNDAETVGEIFRKGLTQWVLSVGLLINRHPFIYFFLSFRFIIIYCTLICDFKLEKNVKESIAVVASGSAHPDPIVNAYQLSQVLTAITTFSKEENKHTAELSLVELIILAHHPLIG